MGKGRHEPFDLFMRNLERRKGVPQRRSHSWEDTAQLKLVTPGVAQGQGSAWKPVESGDRL